MDAVNVATNGTGPAVEQARTVLANAYLGVNAPSTIGDMIRQDNSTNNAYQQLANTVILVSLPIFAYSPRPSRPGSPRPQNWPFSPPAPDGARLATLRRRWKRRPAARRAAVAIGTGFGATAMFTSLEMQHPMVAPGAYYLLAGGILAALGIIAATFPLAHITGPGSRRNR